MPTGFTDSHVCKGQAHKTRNPHISKKIFLPECVVIFFSKKKIK